jgi:CRP/FNR family cyclic AMP-dependent transcriptional regulator
MSHANHVNSQRARVLELDSDLAEGLIGERRRRAVEECVVRIMTVPSGGWIPPREASGSDEVGLLVMSGLLLRRVGVEGRFSAELLGEGDLLRPWQGEDDQAGLQTTTSWRILQPVRLALLDDEFGARMARYPELTGRLVARAVSRSRNLAVNMAIVHQARVDVRLQMLFWHLAGRWGKVRTGEVHLPLRLTHALLAELVAARRPTVTSALSDLSRRGLVVSSEGGWLLSGEPPGTLQQMTAIEAR